MPIIELTESDSDFFLWCRKHQDILEAARKIRLGRVILDINMSGEIKPKYELTNPKNILALDTQP